MSMFIPILLATLGFTTPSTSLPQDAVIFFHLPACPEVYRRFSEMDGKFPLGVPSAELGVIGGRANETLTLAYLPAHIHYVVGEASDAIPAGDNDPGLHIIGNFGNPRSYYNRKTSSAGQSIPCL